MNKRSIAAAALSIGVLLSPITARSAHAKGKSQFCKDFEALSKDPALSKATDMISDSDAIQKNPKAAKAAIHKVVVAFQKLEKSAPDKIQNDLKAVETFFGDTEKLVDQLANVQKEPKKALDAAQKVLKGQAKVTTALTNLSAFTSKECGIS